MDYTSSDLLDKIVNGEHTQAKEIFTSIMGDKVLSELGAKKIELASTLIPSQEKSQSEIAFDKAKEIQNDNE
jgi:hypothetical protein